MASISARLLALAAGGHAACNVEYYVPDYDSTCGNNFVQANKCCPNGLAVVRSKDCFESLAAAAIVKMNADSSYNENPRTLMLDQIQGVPNTAGTSTDSGQTQKKQDGITMVSLEPFLKPSLRTISPSLKPSLRTTCADNLPALADRGSRE